MRVKCSPNAGRKTRNSTIVPVQRPPNNYKRRAPKTSVTSPTVCNRSRLSCPLNFGALAYAGPRSFRKEKFDTRARIDGLANRENSPWKSSPLLRSHGLVSRTVRKTSATSADSFDRHYRLRGFRFSCPGARHQNSAVDDFRRDDTYLYFVPDVARTRIHLIGGARR